MPMSIIQRKICKSLLPTIAVASVVTWLLFDILRLYSGNYADGKQRVKLTKTSISSKDTFNYVMSEDAKRWFAGNITFPLTLDSDYVIAPRDLCPPDTDLDYLIVVHTATGHHALRQAIRDTFGRRHLFGHLTARTVFLLGLANRVRRNKNIEAEANLHNDIIQGPFLDTYQNITHKAVMGLRWINTFCPRVNLILKTDDDTVLNIFKTVLLWLPKYSPRYRHIICEVEQKNHKMITRMGRPEGWIKWLVEDWWFRGLTHYPFPHCNGYFLMFTGDLVAPMLAAAKVNPFFWIDDIYIYGMLPLTVGDVTFEDLDLSRRTNFVQDFENCLRKMGVTACDTFLNDNRIAPEHMNEVWTSMLSYLSEQERGLLHLNDTGR